MLEEVSIYTPYNPQLIPLIILKSSPLNPEVISLSYINFHCSNRPFLHSDFHHIFKSFCKSDYIFLTSGISFFQCYISYLLEMFYFFAVIRNTFFSSFKAQLSYYSVSSLPLKLHSTKNYSSHIYYFYSSANGSCTDILINCWMIF